MRGLEPPLPCGNWNLKSRRSVFPIVSTCFRLTSDGRLASQNRWHKPQISPKGESSTTCPFETKGLTVTRIETFAEEYRLKVTRDECNDQGHPRPTRPPVLRRPQAVPDDPEWTGARQACPGVQSAASWVWGKERYAGLSRPLRVQCGCPKTPKRSLYRLKPKKHGIRNSSSS